MLRAAVRLSAILSSACLLGGCISLGLHDTARTAPPGESANAEPAAQPTEAQAPPDSGGFVTPPSVVEGSVRHQVDIVDTLTRGASRDGVMAKCQEIGMALRRCGQSNDTLAELLRAIQHQEDAVRRIWPGQADICLVCGPCSGLLGTIVGILLGFAAAVETYGLDQNPSAEMSMVVAGAVTGCAVGSAAGVATGHARRTGLLARHRARVNQLVRRANQVLAGAP